MSPYKLLSISNNFVTRALLVTVALLLLSSNVVMAATLGVGVGTGKIKLDQPIKPSLSYNLPAIAVFNNGDVNSDYGMTVEFNETQAELKPAARWFTFSPQQFSLSPGKSQQVEITLKPEYSAKPGEYFAYLEAHPVKKDESGKTAIKIAAATKLNFKIVPANSLQRIYYALLDIWGKYKPFIITVSGTVAIVIIVLLAKKYLKIEVRRKK